MPSINFDTSAKAKLSTLEKTLAFLKTMAITCDSLSVAEIADVMGVTRPTAYSIVKALTAEGFLEQIEDSSKYRIGDSLYILGQYYPRNFPFLLFAEKYVLKLYSELQLRVNVCVFKEPMTALVVASKDSSLTPRRVNGYTLPAYGSSSGKLFLSSFSDAQVLKYAEQSGLEAITKKTITDPARLLEQLAEIREQGYAIDDEELIPGQVCMAAPVYDSTGSMLCSISLAQCPASRFLAERDHLIHEVTNAATQISLDLGYSAETPRLPFQLK